MPLPPALLAAIEAKKNTPSQNVMNKVAPTAGKKKAPPFKKAAGRILKAKSANKSKAPMQPDDDGDYD